MLKLYYAKYLVSGTAPALEDGAIVVKGDTIVATGCYARLKQDYPQAEKVVFDDAILVPLLINTHTHLELTDFPHWAAAAGRHADPDNFVDWILNLIKVKAKLERQLYHKSIINGLDQSLRAGTGAVGDILAHHSARAAYQAHPIEGTLFLETLGQQPEVINRVKTELNKVLEDRQLGAVDFGISPHSPYTISSTYLKQIYERCRRDGLSCTTHIAESAEEVEFLQQGRGKIATKFYPFVGWENHIPHRSGLSPVEYLQQQGGLFPQNLLVHGVQLTSKEISILAAEKMYLALCPRSNARLKVGKAPAAKLLKAGVKLCLGTDSLASCDSLSIWDEMAFAHQWFAGELDAPTLFRLATCGGAEALALDHRLGSLQKGKKAAFQVLKPQSKVASAELFDYFVSPHCAQDIVQVYHNGMAQLSGLNL